MRKFFVAAMVALMVLAFAPAASAGDPGETYLALGDSVAAGTQQPAPFTNKGYTNILYRYLRRVVRFDTFVNLACPGDDTAEMLDGDASDGSLCYGSGAVLPPGGTSQLDAAVAYITANPGEVGLITLTIGANDILACDPTDPGVEACVAAQLGQIGGNLPVILATLQAVAPGVPIVAMNYYNPNLAFWLTGPPGMALAAATQDLTVAFNGTLEAIYGGFGVPVADVENTFRTFRTRGEPPLNVRTICQYTLMCEKVGQDWVLSDYDPIAPGPQTDIHPSNVGYRKIKATFVRTLAAEDLFGLASILD